MSLRIESQTRFIIEKIKEKIDLFSIIFSHSNVASTLTRLKRKI